MIIFGQSGQGESVLLQAEARRLGLTYKELIQRMEATAEKQSMRKEEEDRAEEQRLNAVREAFWHNTPEGITI